MRVEERRAMVSDWTLVLPPTPAAAPPRSPHVARTVAPPLLHEAP